MPFDYAAFIAHLTTLVETARGFAPVERHRDHAAFRRWKHEVVDLIVRIGRLRYDVNTGLESRRFQIVGYGSYSSAEEQQVFNRDLDDSLMELQVVIENYKRYGDPKAHMIRQQKGLVQLEVVPTPAAGTESLKPPEKVTFKWLWEHMSVTVFGTLIAAIGIAFSAGIAVGNWTSVQDMFAMWARTCRTTTSTPVVDYTAGSWGTTTVEPKSPPKK